VQRVRGDQVRFTIEMPDETNVWRSELSPLEDDGFEEEPETSGQDGE